MAQGLWTTKTSYSGAIFSGLLPIVQLVFAMLWFGGTISYPWYIVFFPALVFVGVILAAMLTGVYIGAKRMREMKGRMNNTHSK